MERGTHSDIHVGTLSFGSMKMRRGGEGREGALVRSLLTVGMTTTRTSGGGSLGVCGVWVPLGVSPLVLSAGHGAELRGQALELRIPRAHRRLRHSLLGGGEAKEPS